MMQKTGSPNSAAAVADYASRYTQDFASHYDAMVGWDARRASEGSFFDEILRRSQARTLLDVACGTGFHSAELSKAGFDVVAVDGAPTMVTKAAENFAEHGMRIPLYQADWRSLDEVIDRSFDAILCVGDSFSHLFEDSDRRQALEQFRKAIRPGGILVIDHRNYEALIMNGREERMNRDYCCCGDNVEMALDLISDTVVRNQYTIEETTHELYTYPMRSGEILTLLNETGFSVLQTYGDYKEDFARDDATFIVHVALRT